MAVLGQHMFGLYMLGHLFALDLLSYDSGQTTLSLRAEVAGAIYDKTLENIKVD